MVDELRRCGCIRRDHSWHEGKIACTRPVHPDEDGFCLRCAMANEKNKEKS